MLHHAQLPLPAEHPPHLAETPLHVRDATEHEAAQDGLERRVAELTQDKLGDRERAAAAWRRVLDRTPFDPKGLEALDGLNQALGLWAAQTDVLEKRISMTDGERAQHALIVRLAAKFVTLLGAGWREAVADEAPDAPSVIG